MIYEREEEDVKEAERVDREGREGERMGRGRE